MSTPNRKRISISFSGGRSSAVMLHLIYNKEIEKRPVVVTFANTGAEHPATLDFVRDVEKHWNIPIIWIEADVNAIMGIGNKARVVNYETAARNGEPFEDAVAKYGMFGPSHPQCTSRLKTEPMRAYLRDVMGWKIPTYSTAIGIRADEKDRINFDAMNRGELVYPLVEAGYTKEMVNAYMKRQSFDLGIPGDHYGNCVTCWKKTNRKLYTIAQDDASWFNLFSRLENKYGHHKRDKIATFFRYNRSACDIVTESNTVKFDRYSDTMQLSMWDLMLDVGGSCGDSCEIETDN